MLILAWILGTLNEDAGSFEKIFMIAHYTLGISVFLMVGFRLLWRFMNITPEHVVNNKFLIFISNSVFIFFYSLMLIIPLSGYLTMNFKGRNPVFFGYEIPSLFGYSENWEDIMGEVHELLSTVLIVLIVLHVAAALFHHFIRKDSTLKRILY